MIVKMANYSFFQSVAIKPKLGLNVLNRILINSMKNIIISNLTTFFILFCGASAYASLSMSQIVQPSINCDGQISITADGTAGPFEIQITSNGSITHTFLDIDGTISVTDLCAQDYQVAAINRFGCSHFDTQSLH